MGRPHRPSHRRVSTVPDPLDHLVPGVRERDDQAFAELYEAMAGPLLAFAGRMLRDRGAAEDAVQQAFLELARAADRFEGDGRSLRSWLYRSVRFEVLDEVRRRRRHPEEPREQMPDRPFGEAFDDGMSPELESALAALSPRQRAIMLLRHVHGFDGAEIAEILGSNRAAIYAAGSRAEATLRRLLDGAVESAGSSASVPVEADGSHMEATP